MVDVRVERFIEVYAAYLNRLYKLYKERIQF